MNKYLILVLLFGPFRIYSQNLPVNFELLIPKQVNKEVDTLVFEYKKVNSSIFNEYKRPYILFYSFLGCKGCRQVMDVALNPNYKTWKDELGLDIHCILRYMPYNQYATVKKYYNTPYPIYLDLSDRYFDGTKKYVSDEKWQDARPRLLLINSKGEVKFIPFESVLPVENLTKYIKENI